MERKLLGALLVLVVVGLAVLTSASTPLAFSNSALQDGYFFVKRQILFGLLPGLVLFFVNCFIPTAWWRRLGPVMYGASLLLLILVFVPGFGLTINGSHSWLAIGSFTFQPAELAKAGLIGFMAAFLAQRAPGWEDPKDDLVPLLVWIAVPIFFILLQGDLGSAVIVSAIAFTMLFAARLPLKYLAAIAGVALIGAMLMVVIAPHRINRILAFINPDLVTEERFRYQIDQATLAIGSGGFWGVGFGHSRQKFQYLPEVNADSIFAVYAEEMGFVGSLALITLIVSIGFLALRSASRTPDPLGKYLIIGVASWFLWQSFFNIGGITRAMPLTGVPLPLVSHGGSAYLMMLAAFGIVVGASRNARGTRDHSSR